MTRPPDSNNLTHQATPPDSPISVRPERSSAAMSSSKAAMQSPWIYTATNDLNTMTNSLKNTNLVDKFHLFGKLPLELRRKIWGFATPPPWLIMRRPTPSGPKGYTRQVPADPHACKESRKEFLYHPDVSKDHPTYKLIPELLANAKAIFVSIEQDTVMVELNCGLSLP